MATVYRCHSVVAPRLAGALKVVDLRQDPGARERFVREIDTLATLRHQAVIRVLAAGEVEERYLLYMVMELIEGEDLAQRLAREPVPWPDAVRIFRELADGLQVAHQQGIHHRDIKPANVMITPSGGGVLVDFGIALDQDRTRLTQVGMVPGTVAYMPPELLLSDSHSIDPALADTYAFGLVLYEALTRKRAFPGFHRASRTDLIRLVKEKLDHPPFDPGDLAPDAIRNLIRGCTQPNPLQRPRMTAVVRMMDVALGPAPGLRAAGDLADEATVVASASMLDLMGSSYVATTDTGQGSVPDSEMDTRVLRTEDVEAGLLDPAAFDESTPVSNDRRPEPRPGRPAMSHELEEDTDLDQQHDEAAIRRELMARRRPAPRPSQPPGTNMALVWGSVIVLIGIFVVLVGIFVLLLGWLVL